jgi:Tfp pilus assembly PilM family ATPase
MQQNDFYGRTLVVGLSQPDIEVHALQLPGLRDCGDDEQADAAARWEIERLGRFDKGTTETAYWHLPPARGTRTTALGVAAPRQIITEIWDLCRSAGGDCRRIDAATCAQSRAGVLLRPLKQDEVWGILDVGARAVRLVLCVDDVPVLARSVGGGGQGWTQIIADTLKVSGESAELHKCDHGIRPPSSAGRSGTASGGRESDEAAATAGPLAAVAQMVYSALSAELERIIGEIVRSYEYVLQCYPGRHAADLILAGGGAALGHLDTYLAERLGVHVAQADAYLQRADSLVSVDPAVASTGQASCGREPLAAYFGAIGLAIPVETQS